MTVYRLFFPCTATSGEHVGCRVEYLDPLGILNRCECGHCQHIFQLMENDGIIKGQKASSE